MSAVSMSSTGHYDTGRYAESNPFEERIAFPCPSCGCDVGRFHEDSIYGRRCQSAACTVRDSRGWMTFPTCVRIDIGDTCEVRNLEHERIECELVIAARERREVYA